MGAKSSVYEVKNVVEDVTIAVSKYSAPPALMIERESALPLLENAFVNPSSCSTRHRPFVAHNKIEYDGESRAFSRDPLVETGQVPLNLYFFIISRCVQLAHSTQPSAIVISTPNWPASPTASRANWAHDYCSVPNLYPDELCCYFVQIMLKGIWS